MDYSFAKTGSTSGGINVLDLLITRSYRCLDYVWAATTISPELQNSSNLAESRFQEWRVYQRKRGLFFSSDALSFHTLKKC
jgi:hypothetical protein